jgi:hypothetical protein
MIFKIKVYCPQYESRLKMEVLAMLPVQRNMTGMLNACL